MPVALITNYLTDYRLPLYERLAERHELEVLLFGGGERYVPAWFSDLDGQISRARFSARRVSGPAEVFRAAASGRYNAVMAPFAGGAMLPAAYTGAALRRVPFVLWASVWAQPRSATHLLALPLTRRIYRHADAVVAYGEHVRRFAAGIRGRDEGVFLAPQAVESWLFGRAVSAAELAGFRARHSLSLTGPLVLFVGRLVTEKGVEVLAEAWSRLPEQPDPPTLVVAGDGPLADLLSGRPGVHVLGAVDRSELPLAYAAAELTVVPSVPTPRFREPWGLVCNEAMHAGRPVVASDSVGAVAGGLIRDDQSGLVVPAGDAAALAAAIARLLADRELRRRLGDAGREAARAYTYDAMADGFTRALAAVGVS